MQLTDPQRRTLQQLIGTGDRPVFPADLAQRLRDRIEGAARSLDLPETLWLGKEKLNDLGRCEGAFSSKIAGESPPFEHGRDRKSTRLNSSHSELSRMPSSA